MKKLRSRRGVTLVETLIAVALLAMVSAAGAVLSGTVLSTRQGMIETADAQILGSTVLEALSNEVRYAQNLRVNEDGTITLNSFTFGPDAIIHREDGKVHVEVKMKEVDGEGAVDDMKLLPDSAYTRLQVSEIKCEQIGDSDTLKMTVSVSGSNGDLLWTGDLTVEAMNGIK